MTVSAHIEVAQVNLHHATAASAVIASRFLSDNLGILLIQEPWVLRGEVRGLNSRVSKVIWDLSSERPRSGWRVSKEPSMSDHRIIRFALKVEVRDLLPVRIPRNTKWDVFRETLVLNISRVR